MIPPRQIPQLPEIAREIARLTAENGGATWNLVEGNLAGRPFYAVSVFPERGRVIQLGRCPEEIELRPLDIAVEIEEFIRANKGVLIEDIALSIGTWEHEGQLHLDLSITVQDREAALKIGQRFGQLAIFDLATFEEIAVPAAAEVAA